MERQYEKRKKMVYQFICDDFYVPMKMKEMASVLQVKKEERQELKEIWMLWNPKERSIRPRKETM